MKTLIYDWKDKIDEKELDNTLNVINNGGIVIFPTDTVYGIASNITNENAIKKLFELKGRNDNKPICVLTSSVEKIHKVANIKPQELKIINDYMPGALTIILEKKDNISNILTSNLNTIGVRIPNNEISLKILEKQEYPLATTSANLSGNLPATRIEDLIEEFNGKVDIIIDGGTTDLKISSTIVRLEDEEIKILREGSIKIID